MKRTPLKRHSERGLLRKEVGRLHLALLKKQRGDVCEFCGKPGQNIGRFHIIEISRAPRLEFTDENVLLSHWLEGCQVHYHWHHYGKDILKSPG